MTNTEKERQKAITTAGNPARPTGEAGQQLGSQQAHQIVAFDEVAFVIVEEAAVKVAVPGDAHISAML